MSVEQKIKQGYYDNKLEYPKAPERKCSCGNKFFHDAPKFCSECGKPVKEEYDKNYELYSEYKKNYRKERNRLIALFKSDALKECGITNHQKAEQAFSMAWERGHSEGLYRVLDELEELSGLIL